MQLLVHCLSLRKEECPHYSMNFLAAHPKVRLHAKLGCQPEHVTLLRQAVRAADPERSLLARLGAQARRALPALDLARGLQGSPP